MRAEPSARVRDFDAAFRRNAEACAAFLNEHGRPPTRATDDPTEKSLAAWVGGVRQDLRRDEHRRVRVTPERVAVLDEVLPGWRTWLTESGHLNRFRTQLENVARFVEEHGYPSVRAKDPVAQRYARWLGDQRAVLLGTPRRPVQCAEVKIAALDERLPLWRVRGARADNGEERFTVKAKALAAFVAREHRMPSPAAESRDERKLSAWLQHVRAAARGHVGATMAWNETRAQIMDELVPGWNDTRGGSYEPLDAGFTRRVQELRAFLESHGRTPRESTPPRGTAADEDEARLGRWLVRLRYGMNTHARGVPRGIRFTPEREAILDEVIPDWRDSLFPHKRARA